MISVGWCTRPRGSLLREIVNDLRKHIVFSLKPSNFPCITIGVQIDVLITVGKPDGWLYREDPGNYTPKCTIDPLKLNLNSVDTTVKRLLSNVFQTGMGWG